MLYPGILSPAYRRFDIPWRLVTSVTSQRELAPQASTAWIYSERKLSAKERKDLQAQAEENVAQAQKEEGVIDILGPGIKKKDVPVELRVYAEMLEQALNQIPEPNRSRLLP